jgi:hypothetical protein
MCKNVLVTVVCQFVLQVEDIDQSQNGLSLDLPNMTDSSGKPLYTGLYSGPYFDLSR